MRAKTFGILATLAFSALSASHAQTAPVEGDGASRTSIFDDRDIARNPFLPIGWKKGIKTQAVVAPTIAADAFKVTSIVLDGTGGGLAMINGRGYAVGEYVAVDAGGRQVGVRLMRVRDGDVILMHEGETIVAPLLTR